jgi:type II secretory pathway pseudopilin PulG
MGIVLTVVSQVWQTMQKREKEDELLFVGDQMRRALALYAANAPGGQRYPQSLEELLKDPRYPDARRYLRKIYLDPITGRADWGLVTGPGDVIMGVYSLSEEEPLKKTEFRFADLAFEGKTKYSEWVFVPKSGLRRGQLPPGSTPK